MQYRRLGRSGLKISALSFGSWLTFHNQLDVQAARALMHQAFDAGVNFFDNAEVYANGESERIMGQILKEWPREEFVVSSKIFWGGSGPNDRGLSRKHLIEGCNKALKRLQVDYVDLLFCHRPDPETPIEETVRAMDHLIAQGKVLYWGTSEWSVEEIEQAFAIAKELRAAPPTMEQPQYNLFHRHRVEVEYAPLYDTYGLGTTVWSPLASGLLTGKYRDGIPAGTRLERVRWLQDARTPERVEAIRKLSRLAQALGTSTAQLALAWCLKNPNVSTVILGASNAKQLAENLEAEGVAERWDDGVLDRIAQCVEGIEELPS